MSQKPKRKNYRAAYKIRVTQPDIDQSTQLLFKQLMEKSHAFKAAEALDDLSVAALSAANVLVSVRVSAVLVLVGVIWDRWTVRVKKYDMRVVRKMK